MKIILAALVLLPSFVFADGIADDPNLQDRICMVNPQCNGSLNPNVPEAPAETYFCYAKDRNGYQYQGWRAYTLKEARKSILDYCAQASGHSCKLIQCYQN